MMSFRFFATAAVAALCLAATPVLAQQATPKPAAPKQGTTAAPKKAAKPAAAPAAAATNDAPPTLEAAITPQLSGSQPEWTKICQTDPQAKKEICATNRAVRLDTGQTLMTAVLIQIPADKQQTLRFVLPVGALIPNGVSLFLDDASWMTAQYLVCSPEGCLVEAPLNDAQVSQLRKGKTMKVAFKTPNQNVALPLGMDGLAKALDGKPTDPKQIADEQRKLQQQLQEAAEKARKDLNTAPAAPAAPATPATPPANGN